jgi:hypothetical protein
MTSSSLSPLYLYVRIQKVYLPRAPRSRLTIYQSLRPEDSGIYAPLSRLKEADMFGCATILILRTIPSRESQLSIVINEFRPELGDVEFARLILPLTWFRVNHVISYSYPLITRVTDEQPPMVLVDVHLSQAATAPFGAPFGNLKVVPTWTVPSCMQKQEGKVGEMEMEVKEKGKKEGEQKKVITSVIPPEVDSWLEAKLDVEAE